jgi:hypothetical protein
MIFILIGIVIFFVLRWIISGWLERDGYNNEPWDFGHH